MINASMKLSSPRQRQLLGAVLTVGAALISLQPVVALDETSPGYYSPGYRPITNDGFLALSDQSPDTWLFRAEIAIKRQQWDKAIKYLRKSMAGNDDEIDTHKWLALCLEEKLLKQTERDPETFKECVNEWVIVLRNLKGAEKGLSFKNGISPTNNKKWEDEQGAMLARQHLIKLTGYEPKRWEATDKYIARITKEVDAKVSGKILAKKTAAAPAPKSMLDQF